MIPTRDADPWNQKELISGQIMLQMERVVLQGKGLISFFKLNCYYKIIQSLLKKTPFLWAVIFVIDLF